MHKSRPRRFYLGERPLLGVVLVVLFGALSSSALGQPAELASDTTESPSRYTFDAEDMPLSEALDRFTAETGADLIYATDLVEGKTSRCRIEQAPAPKVLTCLLLGTGLAAEQRHSDRFVLKPRPDSQEHTLSGFVLDADNGETLAGANLYVPALQRGTTTNEHGFYSLTLPEAPLQLVVSYLGYENKAFSLELQSDRRRDIELSPSTVQAGSLEVTAEQTPLQQTTRTSTVEITPTRAVQTPTLLGETDVMKTLQLMPGAQSGNEGTSGLYVRGGTPDQNQILLDGAPLYNVSHLFGFLSVFNPDIVQNVRLTKGGFPARYGGHLSSVVEVSVEDGNRKHYEAEGNVGLLSSRLAVQGPIVEDQTSFLLAGRRTYADLLMRPFVDDDEWIGYHFYDVNAKINHQFSSTDRVFWSLYTGDDRISSRAGANSDSDFDFGWGNITSTLRWTHVFGDQLFGSTTLRYSQYQFDINAEREGRDGDLYRLHYRSGIEDWGLQTNLDYSPNSRHDLRAGTEITFHQFRPGAFQYKDPSGSGTPLDTTIAPSDPVRAFDASVYLEDNLTWTSRLKTNLGVRASTFLVEETNYWTVQPRLSIRYLLPQEWALKGSYSLMRQPIHLLTNSSIGLPTDLWVSSTQKVPPERAHQVTLGLARSFRNGEYEVRLESYGKRMNHLIEYKQGASFTLTTDTDWQNRIETGRGWSYGAELLLRRTRGRTSGWFGYTLSWTRRQFDALNQGNPFPFRYDRRHDVSTTVTHELTDVTTLTATWVYGTGNAITLPVTYYRDGRGGRVEDYGERNSFRMRPYHRLDLGLDFKWGDQEGFHALKVGAYNAYNRKNPYFLTTEETADGALQGRSISLFPVLPYINYRFKL